MSRNLWYGYLDLYTEGVYGKQIVLDDALIRLIAGIIKEDSSEKSDPPPTEINWYLYGKTKTEDAIGDEIRPNIMIRRRQNSVAVRCNMSDHDFAVNLDAILSFENSLEKVLADGEGHG